MDSTEIARFDNLQSLFSNCLFSQVFVLEVGVDLGFLGILGVFEVQLGLECPSVLNSLLLVGISLVDLVLGSNQVDVDLVDLSLEVSVFGVQLFNSLLKVDHGLGFSCG